MEIDIYSQEGKVIEKIALNKDIFEVPVKEALITKALVMQLSNARNNIAHTKTRSERQGSTRKIYQQKGTGRARAGTVRSPVRKKGGVAFGPRNNRNFEKSLTKKERKGALFSLLSLKAKDNLILGLDSYIGEISTKNFVTLLEKLPIDKKVLIVLSEKNELIQKSSNNIPEVKTILANYLNPKDLLQYKHLLFLKDAFKKLESVFLKK